MNTYENAIFNFFTTEESFVNLIKIASHLPSVKSKLLRDYWDAVFQDLQSRCTQLGPNWNVVRLEQVESSISKIILYKREWQMADAYCPQLGLSIERLSDNPFYGPFIHNRAANLCWNNALAYFRSKEIPAQFKIDDSTWYPFYRYAGIICSKNDAEYISLLPEKRNEMVKKVSSLIIESTKAFEADLDYVNCHCRTVV
jgi:hypothetical protein